MRKLFAGLLALLLLAGCAPSIKKQRARFVTYAQMNPVELAEICEKTFPFKETLIPGIPDTVTNTVLDTVKVTVPCPDGTRAECPPFKTVYKNITRVDTAYQEDTRRIVILQDYLAKQTDALGEAEEKITDQEAKIEELKQANAKKLKIIIGFSLAFLGLGFLKFKRII